MTTVTGRKHAVPADRSLTASSAPGRRVDQHGVVIGPWSDSARRAVQAQREIRMARRGASR